MYSDTLFIGSSQILYWPTTKSGIKIATSGLLSHELLTPRVLAKLPKHANQIVVYSGSNDLFQGIDPVVPLLQFVETLRYMYPSSKIVVLAILLSPRAKKLHTIIQHANARIKRGLPSQVKYVNVNRTLLHPKYYREDGLHLNSDGYDVWERYI